MRPNLYAPGSPYHQNRRWTHPHSLRCLQAAIAVLGKPDSLIDVGCAEGVHVAWAKANGIEAMGIDLAVPEGDPALVRADLCRPIDVGARFDWVLCWEVAEHLPAEAAVTLVDTLVRHMRPTGRILFTAAGPGQRGPGHVHCAEPWFWQDLFRSHGLTFAEALTATLRKRWATCSPLTPWYAKNAMLFWRQA